MAKAGTWTNKRGRHDASLSLCAWSNNYQASGDAQANGGVRGGTIRLLPVDSKAEAKRSRLLSS